MNYKIIQVLGFLLIAVFLTPFVTSAAIGVTWTATSTTPGYISPNTINGYAPGIGVTGNSNFNMGTNSMTGFGSSSPYANIAIHANDGETTKYLFAIGSSTQTATTTLFSVSNTGAASTTQLFGANLASCSGSNALTWSSGLFGCTNVGAAAFPFTPTTAFGTAANSTSTLIGFLNGLYATASSTIGNGTQQGGLTINGGATTTGNAYFAGNVGVGTMSPATTLQVNGTTSVNKLAVGTTDMTAGGVLGAGAKFTIQASDGNTIWGAVNSSNQRRFGLNINSTGGFTFYDGTNASGSAWSAGITQLNGNVGVGSTSPWAKLSVDTSSLGSGVPEFSIGSSTRQDLVVMQSGNVGVGVNTPSTQLQVAANSTSGEMTPVILQNVSNANGAATSLGFSQNATLSGPLTGKISSIRNSAASFDMALYSSTGAGTVTEGLRLTSARNLGVGSTSPQAKLAVHANNGDTNTQLFTVASSTQTATTTLFSIDNVGNSTQGIGSTSSTTQTVIGKWQMDTYNTAGTQICAFFVGTTLSASTGACNK